MIKKCDLCGKGNLFGVIWSCTKCGQNICSRHKTEQFKKYSYSLGTVPYAVTTSYYYPNGKSVNRKKFVCFQCRTGKIPNEILS